MSAPLQGKHFVWRCTIDGPALEFPLKISSLIDNGCHLILIHPDLVTHLGLTPVLLPTPEVVDIAIKSIKNKSQLELSHFVFYLQPLLMVFGRRNVYVTLLHLDFPCLLSSVFPFSHIII